MFIPPKLKIKGKIWTIKPVTRFSGERGKMGICDFDLRTIQLQKDLLPQDLMVTLIHEILHAVFPHDLVGMNTEEEIIEQLDSAFVSALVELGVLESPHAFFPPNDKNHFHGVIPDLKDRLK